MRLALMAEAQAELECLLPQRADRPLGQLCNLINRRLRLRVCAQLLHVSFGVFARRALPCCLDNFLRFFSHFSFLFREAILLPQIF